jgi:uncharacterized protein YndB with AHSA1/START domain
VGSYREQALIEAPVEEVWNLVGDPRRYPEWAGEEFVEVTGLPEVQKGAEYEQVTRSPSGQARTTFTIETLDDLHEIRLRCNESGFYARWELTEADGGTFADVEIGMDPTSEEFRSVDATNGKRWYRRVVKTSIDGVKRALARREPVGPS